MTRLSAPPTSQCTPDVSGAPHILGTVVCILVAKGLPLTSRHLPLDMDILELHAELLAQAPGARDEDGAALQVVFAVGALGEEREAIGDAARGLDGCRSKEVGRPGKLR